jgi:homoserine O-acetyltransferase
MSIKQIHNNNFELESGVVLPKVKIAYKTYGQLNTDHSNVIWVCHALTANAEVKDWWPEMFGAGRVLDPEKYFIICPNFLGSCYGTTGANSPEVPDEFKQKNFPLVTIRDMVKAHRLVAQHLKITRINLLIGASLGGQQALQWAVEFPKEIRHLCVLATNAFHSPWGMAFNASQRLAMEADESFQKNLPDGGKAGLKAARSIALLSYRTPEIYNTTQAENDLDTVENFKAETYQNYQGEKLVNRFCPYAYYSITKSMDSHNVGRDFNSVKDALEQIKARTLCIALSTDRLFLPEEQQFLAKYIADSEYIELDSIYGHDGFLVEAEQINKQVLNWLNPKNESSKKQIEMKKKSKIGLFGYGCVGQGFYEVLQQSENTNTEIAKIVVKDKYKKRDLPDKLFFYQPTDILLDNSIDTVVELIDDAEAAYDIVKSALKLGKHVVSANKKLIAHHLEELVELAQENQVSFLYEASVCASIPIIRNIEDYFKSDSIDGFQGICNGTTNYILSKTAEGLTYNEALSEAQDLGYAESDPTLDVDGFDAKYKLGILLKHAYGVSPSPDEVFNCGIRHVQKSQVTYADALNSKLKLYSYARRIENKVIGFVAPFLVPKTHPNYNVEYEFNAVNINAKFAKEQLFLGRGAGSVPTASAVLSDVQALCENYKYAYVQTEKTENLKFTNDFYLKIVLFAAEKQQLESIQFEHTETESIESQQVYKVGWVHFKNLNSVDFNAEDELFFIVVSETFELSLNELEHTIEEAVIQ